MTSTTRIPNAKITGVSGTLMKWYAKKLVGKVPSPLGAYWHNRPVLKDFFAFGGKAQKWKACERSLKSFAHMAVASLVGCTHCLDYGYFQAHNEGLDLDKAREAPRWRESSVFTPLEREAMAYAEAMSQTPPTVTDEMSASLLRQLGPAAMIELTAFIALANCATRTNVALGIESDEYAKSCGLKPLAEPTARTEATSTA